MAIAPLNSVAPRAYTAPRPAAAAISEPTGGASYYQSQYSGASTGPSVGKMVAWGGGAIALRSVWGNFFRNPRGWALLAVLGAGAFAGNWVYNKLTGKA